MLMPAELKMFLIYSMLMTPIQFLMLFQWDFNFPEYPLNLHFKGNLTVMKISLQCAQLKSNSI